jgi:hypothetical protein
MTPPGTTPPADEILTRFGKAAESAQKLGEDAARADAVLGIHGVSVTARPPKRPAPCASRSIVEKHFRVHNTGNDPLHRTVELPKPVTQEVADLFNSLFGRS